MNHEKYHQEMDNDECVHFIFYIVISLIMDIDEPEVNQTNMPHFYYISSF